MTTQPRYTHGHHESVLKSHTWRTIGNSAAYLEPQLAAGLSLLDVGCGPGTITVEFADRLLRMYYDTEQPIPLDTEWVSRRLRVGSDCVFSVLREHVYETILHNLTLQTPGRTCSTLLTGRILGNPYLVLSKS